MRARMALRYSGIEVEIREISLRNKPPHMLQLSPKGTVPVLLLEDGTVIDESMDIMLWTLTQSDPGKWLADSESSMQLIAENDGTFKTALDRYKYASRFPERKPEVYRAEGEVFLIKLDKLLSRNHYLLRDSYSLADIAIFPFVRQFASVDTVWFKQAPYPKLRIWLDELTSSELFLRVMEKQRPGLKARAAEVKQG
jgi:glutathione S-transferase